jgi:vitamin B12 transporter
MIRYLLFFSIAAAPVFAQSDSSRVLENVVIHGNRIQPTFDETAASVIVISAADIQQAPAQSVADLLHYYAGIDIRQRGANGVQADAGIRGSTFDQVLILINGVKISDAQTGHHSLNLPVDIDNVERIEVLKGPAARIFGQNAFAGAINIITKNPDDNFIKVQAQAGAYGLGGLRLAASLGGEKVKQYFSASRDFSEGYQYNTDYSISNLFYQSEIKTKKGKVNVLGGLTDRSFGANGFYASPDFKDQYEAVQTSLVAISLQTRSSEKVTVNHRLYWRRNQDEYLFIRNDPGYFRNFHINNTVGYETNVTLMNKKGITGLGLDVNQLWLVSTNLGDRERTVATFFVEHRFESKNQKLSATPGVQLNYYSDFGTNVFPGLDIGYALSDKVMLYGNTGYTYRVPTYTDLYYRDPANVGNPNLLPEYAISYEGGFRLVNAVPFQIQGAYFVRNGKRIIDWTKAVSTDPWQPDNLIDVNMSGVEVSLAWRPQDVPLISKAEVGYTHIDAAKATDLGFSRYALENLSNQFVANVALKYSARMIHAVNFRYSDRVNLPAYSVVDTRLTWQGTSLGLFADVTNIFDVTYKETNLVTMPGRWFKMGVSYRH